MWGMTDLGGAGRGTYETPGVLGTLILKCRNTAKLFMYFFNVILKNIRNLFSVSLKTCYFVFV